jgi:hypothetical protein
MLHAVLWIGLCYTSPDKYPAGDARQWLSACCERNHPLNQPKYGTISHQGLPYNNPFSVEKIEGVIDLLILNAQSTVLDIGSGKNVCLCV